MYCYKCGQQFEDGSAFCPYCGAPAEQPAQPQTAYNQNQGLYGYPAQNQGQYGYPAQNQNYAQNPYGYADPGAMNDPLNDPRGMKWFKFIIYFQLFAAAVVDVINGITCISGSHYGGDAYWVYSFYPSLKTADVLFGICSLAVAGFAIYVRMRLAKFRRNGPTLYYIFSGATIVISLIYIIAVCSALGASVGELLSASPGTGSSVITSIIMLVVNYIYFGKRADLFKN